MCESVAFVEALLYVILKAPAIFFSVTAIGHPFSRSSKKVYRNLYLCSGGFINVILFYIVVVETLNSSLTLRCFTELKI